MRPLRPTPPLNKMFRRIGSISWTRSHFETTAMDVMSMYERIIGQELDLTIDPEADPDEA